MAEYIEISIGDLFGAVNGRPKFIKDFIDSHPGCHPVYSASLTKPFGYVDEFEYEGHYLTWVMNGYGGRVQEIRGRFSANRDRGVFVPRDGVEIPDLTYLRFAMEPQLVATAVGRRVDGRLNEYTKIYPRTAEDVMIRLPVNGRGQLDYAQMTAMGERLRRIERAQADVRRAQDSLLRAAFALDIGDPSVTVSLGSDEFFSLSIGTRVLRSEHAQSGIPVYSANARTPFGFIATSNLVDFEKPSLLWGIDGIFDWNLIPSGVQFATTDHCGRLQILDDRIDPVYIYAFLRATRGRYGFDRVYRANLDNMKADVTVSLPVDKRTGEFCLKRQRALASSFRELEEARAASLTALEDVLKARMSI
ncbi:hypothetical protein [Burkholderia sp. Ed8]|uniref:hypothetical protein n=1 Tax=Burkholderia sp. Ed8 TaxID=3112957 RepID=UPI00345C6B45